jgi:integrase/recombinase XerD
MRCIINGDVVLSRPLEGPLSAHVGAFATSVREQGYALNTQHRQILLAAYFSRWLGQKAVSARRVCKQFLEFLRREGIIPAEKTSPCPLTPVEQQTRAFETYLRNERALAEATIAYYVPFTRGFLTDRFGNGRVVLSRLSAGDVVRFVQRQVPRLHRNCAKLLTTALRSFLNYARYRGDITDDLAAAVPCVAAWSITSIPRDIPADAVRRLLASIDRRVPVGRRDYAIFLLLARLGLRASEVVLLELDDIDWAAGEVRVRGKGGQRTALPLPAEVGKALVSYIRHGRPQSTSRRVFLRCRGPIRGFLGPEAIASLVGHTLTRAGIRSPSRGAHQFRHALAVQMLRHGASLTEIGEVLRHRSPQTTTIYAKVDLLALRPLALPWPGGAR